MSRQFRCFLLPSDIEALIAHLKRDVGLTLIDPRSSSQTPTVIDTPMHDNPPLPGRRDSVSAHCYLIQDGAELRSNYIEKQGYWFVHEDQSEVIQFTGFEFDGTVLVEGRFYFQSDVLLGDAIWPKRDEFLRWANRIFRCAKRHLSYRRGLDSYVGEAASAWKEDGGLFAWTRYGDGVVRMADDRPPL